MNLTNNRVCIGICNIEYETIADIDHNISQPCHYEFHNDGNKHTIIIKNLPHISFTTSELQKHISFPNENEICIRIVNSFVIEDCIISIRDESVELLKKHILYYIKCHSVTSQHFYALPATDYSKTFYTQSDAIIYHNELLQNKITTKSKVYTYESFLTGKRRFLVSTQDHFISTYLSLPSNSRHVYEIIRENFPCRMYFDLEYPKNEGNLLVDGERLVSYWISIVSWKIYEIYGILINPSNVIELDSSNNDKFSRHIIIILNNCHNINSTSHTLNNVCNHGNNSSNMNTTNNSHDMHSNHKKRKSQYSSLELDGGLRDYKDKEYLFRNNLEVGKFVELVLNDLVEPLPITADCVDSMKGMTQSCVTQHQQGTINKSDLSFIIL
jgi:hypothetical protein